MLYELHHIDTCVSDYFSGHHLPVIQVALYPSMTYQDLKDDLLSYQATEHLDDLDVTAYNKAVEELFLDVDLTLIVDEDIQEDEEDECIDSVYMFFVLETLEGDMKWV